MRFGSVCSGIEAASVAWEPLGWEAAWFSEIEPFPCAVLAHHYPNVSNLGDMTSLPERILSGEVESPDLFCGGTPCQAFSVAGLRKSLDDARGNLSLTFCEIANAIDSVRSARREPACVIFWENVPGVLSTQDNAFGCFLAGIAGEGEPLKPPGGKWTNAGAVLGPTRAVAWRVLDAQYFGVAQRRRRVFVVASAREGFDPTAVLFEFDSVRRDSAPSREAGKGAPAIPSCSIAERRMMQPVAFHPTQNPINSTDVCHSIGTGNGQGCATAAVAFGGDIARTLQARHDSSPCVDRGMDVIATAMQVRRLTPRECERLQGFPDGYTAIPWRKKPADQCPDGPRYKALGNSWAVPVVRWIGKRIDLYVKTSKEQE